MLEACIIFATTLIATALSSMSGGGASMINIPILLWMGAPFPLAVATQNISSAAWVLPASHNFLSGRKMDWMFLITFALVGLVGVYFGVLMILNIDQRIIEFAIGALILILVLYTYFKKDVGLAEHRVYSKARQSIAYIFAPLLGFYESFFGAGNGIMFALLTFKARGFDFIDALGYYFSIAFPWVIFATGLLIYEGFFSWPVMIPAIIGSTIGGYIGSKFVRYKGNRFIKAMFVAVGGVLGLKLVLGT